VDFVALGGIDFNSIGGISNLQNVVHPPVSGDVLDRSLSLFRTDRFASDFPTDGLSVGFVKNNIGVFLEALATVTEVEVLANPKVLALNRQMAEIIVGGRLGYRTTTTTETATVQQVEFLETGTQLRFRPFVADDGFIRLEIHPENSTGSVDARTELPTKNTTEVTTNVLVRQGQTLVIGGLIEKQRNDIVKKVPILGDLPIAGALFRRTEKAEMRREILVLLTPRLIDPSRPEEADPGRLSLRDPGPRSRRYVARAGDLLRGNDLSGAYFWAGAADALEPAAEAARLQEEIVNRWTAALLPTPPGGRP
jgi:type II secretory pathway component GspD/PulD (secretin)